MPTQQHLPTLRPGDTIGLITPASAVQPEQVEAGIALLTEMGYDCRIAAHAYDNNGITAAPPPARIADFYDFLEDPSVKAIWALRGGYVPSNCSERLIFRSLPAIPSCWSVSAMSPPFSGQPISRRAFPP